MREAVALLAPDGQPPYPVGAWLDLGCGDGTFTVTLAELLEAGSRPHTFTAAIRKRTGERARAVGIVACLQTHGSRANGHPHLPLRVTDGGFRPDGTCVSWPVPDTARLTEAFRRAGLLTGPHAGFHLHTAVWVPEEDRALATRLARYGAMRIVAFITQGSVIDQILTHRRARPAPVAHAGARSPAIDAGPFGVRGHPTGASDGSPPASAPHLDRRSRGAPGARARSTARRRPPRGAGEVGDRSFCSTDRRPTPTAIPIPNSYPVGDEDLAACRAAGFERLDTDQSYLDFPDASFDLVWCRHALEHSVAPYFTLAGFGRVLAPGGTLYVEVPGPDTYWGFILRRS